MAVHTHAHHRGASPGPGRKGFKRMDERLRRERRELVREVQERVGRACYPVREDGALPKID